MSLPTYRKPNYYFDDPRLRFTVIGRIFAHVIGYLTHALVIVITFTFLSADLPWLKGLGALLALYLLDRLVHIRHADRRLEELPQSGDVNLASYVTPSAFAFIERSFDKSAFTKENFYLELARELASAKEIKNVLRRLDISPEEFVQKAEELLDLAHEHSKSMTREDRRIAVEILMKHACSWALAEKRRFIDTPDLLAALPRAGDEFIDRLWVVFNITSDDTEKALIFAAAQREYEWWRGLPDTFTGLVFGKNRGLRHRIMNRAWTSRPTPMLDRMSVDLTDLAREEEVGFMVGHEAEYSRLAETLARPISPNALLIGEPGSGKQTVVKHLAFNLVKDEVPPALFDKRLVELRLSNLVAGATETELQAKLQTIVREIELAGNIIVYIPEIHNLVKTSGSAYLSAADALMPVIGNNLFPMIGETYPREFKEFIEPRTDFVSSFEKIEVKEISESDAEKLLTYESLLLERKSKVFVSFGAIKTAVTVAHRHFRTKLLPASAEELLKSAVILAGQADDRYVGSDEVIKAAEEKTNVPIHHSSKEEGRELLELENTIHQRFIDQEEAVKAVSDALREYRAGLSRGTGPIASFLFVGPTGVGKTELSKILAKIQFGSEQSMVRFDMTEYQDRQSFYRFIGSPDGKVSGALTDAVLNRPYSLILLDEFEKAYPDILNLFLQVLDDGRLTDNLGRTVSFENTIVIATSNAHSDIINSALRQGESMAHIAEYLKTKLTDVFKPELINRFSKIIVFRDLGVEHMEKIAELNVAEVIKKASTQGIALAFEPEAIKMLAKLGYEPAFGARPLRRVIEERIRAPLAAKLLEGGAARGSGIRVIWDGKEFQFVNASVFVDKPVKAP